MFSVLSGHLIIVPIISSGGLSEQNTCLLVCMLSDVCMSLAIYSPLCSYASRSHTQQPLSTTPTVHVVTTSYGPGFLRLCACVCVCVCVWGEAGYCGKKASYC